ncbi:hypothetical protein RO1_13840 [Roseburia intestinalis XB6B4]|uniref:Uncharacterized protein n=1 Tax=Roseburia intestinalis XB6B4 TaxID=718255 RepID=D4KXB9_9FIRM|nr:hypothetical protein ROI_23690 [Roseburia intestinalis M50/1]CBL12009.1 hypothetical protein RO1_13840 [Roseburia intestinalis XB6B4]
MLSLTEKLPQAQNKKDSNNLLSIVTVFLFGYLQSRVFR